MQMTPRRLIMLLLVVLLVLLAVLLGRFVISERLVSPEKVLAMAPPIQVYYPDGREIDGGTSDPKTVFHSEDGALISFTGMILDKEDDHKWTRPGDNRVVGEICRIDENGYHSITVLEGDIYCMYYDDDAKLFYVGLYKYGYYDRNQNPEGFEVWCVDMRGIILWQRPVGGAIRQIAMYEDHILAVIDRNMVYKNWSIGIWPEDHYDKYDDAPRQTHILVLSKEGTPEKLLELDHEVHVANQQGLIFEYKNSYEKQQPATTTWGYIDEELTIHWLETIEGYAPYLCRKVDNSEDYYVLMSGLRDGWDAPRLETVTANNQKTCFSSYGTSSTNSARLFKVTPEREFVEIENFASFLPFGKGEGRGKMRIYDLNFDKQNRLFLVGERSLPAVNEDRIVIIAFDEQYNVSGVTGCQFSEQVSDMSYADIQDDRFMILALDRYKTFPTFAERAAGAEQAIVYLIYEGSIEYPFAYQP